MHNAHGNVTKCSIHGIYGIVPVPLDFGYRFTDLFANAIENFRHAEICVPIELESRQFAHTQTGTNTTHSNVHVEITEMIRDKRQVIL